MNYISAAELASKWGVSKRMVQKYCTQNRIPNAILKNGAWFVPENTPKPKREKKKEPEIILPPLVKKIQYQRKKNNHYGIYEYIQVNLAYSSNRMASNRLTRTQVTEMYRTHKISNSFEATKIDDIIEVINHFIAVQFMVDVVMAPLTQTMIKKFHQLLTYGTYSDRQHKLGCGEYRTCAYNLGTTPDQISSSLSELIKEYEQGTVTLDKMLDFHVKFEKIHPFDDYNGRVGRIIMMKECLRHGIDPFVIDDKHRGSYNRGIAAWTKDADILCSVVKAAQERLQGHMEVCKLMEYNRM
jgi:Fic family protein